MTNRENVEACLTAYIYPVKVETEEQREAMHNAVDAQLEYEESGGIASGIPSNVSSISSGSYSMSFSGKRDAVYSRNALCQAAWAILFNAGLIKYSLPVAKKL